MVAKTKRKRAKRRATTIDGRERYTTTLLPEARAALEAEAIRLFGVSRRANVVIERLAREHLEAP